MVVTDLTAAGEVKLGRLASILWKIFGTSFAITSVGVVTTLLQGDRASRSRIGNITAIVCFFGGLVACLTLIVLFGIQIRRLRLRWLAGERFSDHDPWRRD
jgi:Kef-type K+ transport system membrane component KefB